MLKNLASLLVAIAFVVVFYYASDSTPKPPPQVSKEGGWTVWRDASIVSDRGNDGDSFLVRHAKGETVVRLYYVDAPEKRKHKHNGKRLRSQAEYFGASDWKHAVNIGLQAKKHTLKRLAEPFDVYTQNERVYDSDRIYGFIKTKEGWLSEELVSLGLARIHTKGVKTPDNVPFRQQKKRLKKLEKASKNRRLGGWSH